LILEEDKLVYPFWIIPFLSTKTKRENLLEEYSQVGLSSGSVY